MYIYIPSPRDRIIDSSTYIFDIAVHIRFVLAHTAYIPDICIAKRICVPAYCCSMDSARKTNSTSQHMHTSWYNWRVVSCNTTHTSHSSLCKTGAGVASKAEPDRHICTVTVIYISKAAVEGTVGRYIVLCESAYECSSVLQQCRCCCCSTCFVCCVCPVLSCCGLLESRHCIIHLRQSKLRCGVRNRIALS